MFYSKTLATLLSALTGSFGLHRFYLYKSKDWLAWLLLLLAFMGGVGAFLLVESHRHSLLGWILVIPGACAPLIGCITALIYGLTPDEKWDAQFNRHSQKKNQSGWPVILILVSTLMIGMGLLLAGLAITIQTYYESQVVPEAFNIKNGAQKRHSLVMERLHQSNA